MLGSGLGWGWLTRMREVFSDFKELGNAGLGLGWAAGHLALGGLLLELASPKLKIYHVYPPLNPKP